MAGNAVPRIHLVSMKNRSLVGRKQAKFGEKVGIPDFGKKYFSRGKFLISPQQTYFAFSKT